LESKHVLTQISTHGKFAVKMQRKVEWISIFRRDIFHRDIFRRWRFAFSQNSSFRYYL